MNRKLYVVAVIPARGGSKGLPGKNIVPLMGKPLICYTIEAAKNSKYVTRIIVSTDDEKIAKIAKENGAEVPFLRPADLAKDETPSLPVVQHAVKYIEDAEGCIMDVIVLLQPTSPLRNETYIDDAVEKILGTGADSVITVCRVKQHPYWNFIAKGDSLCPFIRNDVNPTRRQDLPETYAPNGAVYVVRRDVLFNQNSILGKDIRAVVMPVEESIDIDGYFDLFIAEMTLKYWKEWLHEKSKDWK
jgi:N-acylneuraminate cytidylyltransferase/CMP-N,N'-diacetyllegionaminic acid synthase